MIRKILFLFLLFILFTRPCWTQTPAFPELKLIPWPQELKVLDSHLELTNQSRITYIAKELRPLAGLLRQELYQVSGLKLFTTKAPARKGDIHLKIDPSLPGETHTLAVKDHIEITGSCYKTIAMASASLLQAVKGAAIPQLIMKHAPHSAFRALMIDIARQPHTLDTLKQCVILCRLYKINFLQLHLSDDQSFAFECKAFPKLATPGRHFTQNELKELVAFADIRGVTLIPELDAPGHTTAMRRAMPDLFGAPGLSVINIGKEKVLLAMERIIEELCGIFASSPYFHIGADEAYFANLAKDDLAKKAIKEKGFHDVHDLFYQYIVRMNSKVKELGKQTVMWESFPGAGSQQVEIPRDILVMAWETAYQLPHSLLNNGYNIINVSWKPNYLTPGWRWNPEYIYKWNMFRWENHWIVAPSYTPIQLKPYPNNRIIGGMMCSWESRDEMEIPGTRLRLPALSERIWAPELKLPYEHFQKRFLHTDLVLQKLIRPIAFHVEGLTDPQYIGPFYNQENHFSKAIKISMLPMIPDSCIRYTLDGSIPTIKSSLYKKPIFLNKSAFLRTQVFDPLEKKIGYVAAIPYEHHPIIGKAEGLLMQVRHDNGRGRHRTQFGEQVTITLVSAMTNGAIRYTTNGRQPHMESSIYTEPIVLKESGVVMAQYFDDMGQPHGAPWRRSFQRIDAQSNLTTNKPVTASDYATENTTPEKAVDGIVDRNFHWDSSAGAPQWWRVDLEDSHKISKIHVFTYWDGHRFYKYRVHVSLDKKTWTEVADLSQNQKKATSKGFLHEFDPIITRYIRITMLYNSANPGLHLVEVRAFAEKN